MGQSPEEDETTALPRDLRFLKTLVTVLTVVMIAGVITITTLLVIRLNASGPSVTIAPGDFEIPDGVGVVGFSVVNGQTVIVGDDGVIRVYDSGSQTQVQEFTLGE
jgi:uncharacterized integral membrane protein